MQKMSNNFKSVVSILKENICKVYNYDKELILNSFSILKENETICVENCLYLATTHSLPKKVPDGLSAIVIAMEKSTLPECYSEVCTILLKNDTDLLQIINKLYNFFLVRNKNNSFTNRLLEAISNPPSIRHLLDYLLDIAYQEFDNPLLLVDVALCFVAHAGGDQIIDEPFWDCTFSKEYLAEKYENYAFSDGNNDYDLLQKTNFQDSQLIWQDGFHHHHQLVGKISRNGVPVGYLKLLEYNKTITQETAEKMLILCKFIAISMNYTASYLLQDNPLIETFLTSILTHKLNDKNAIEERVNRFSLKLYENLTVIALDTRNLIIDKVYFIKKKLKSFLARETILLFKGNIIILYDHKTKEPFTASELQHFKNLCKNFGVRAGISNSFQGVHNFDTYYHQANTVLELCEGINYSDNVAYYDKFCILHMISLFAEHNDPCVFIHPAVFQLQEYDTQYNRDLFCTLKEYLRNNQNMSLTANKLHIHYNSLKYRIHKLAELTNLDLTDSELLFRLHLSFIVFEYLNKTGMLPHHG
jgi:hypothetical protein